MFDKISIMLNFHSLYPDNYSKKKRRLQDEFLVVTSSNFFSFCENANRQFEFLLKNDQKPGMHFIDWRASFHNLKEFVTDLKLNKRSIFYHHELERFLHYFKCSGDLIYSRPLY